MTTGRLEILVRRDTDLWIKVEPYDQDAHGVALVCDDPEQEG